MRPSAALDQHGVLERAYVVVLARLGFKSQLSHECDLSKLPKGFQSSLAPCGGSISL